ncbi:hypothetical protein EDD86DRAFT_250067 [Gorgonomyces haynaldii]|nr:hypothetical protein EDD86DRAFT_250067 [Gorgonomyces haynaldii]
MFADPDTQSLLKQVFLDYTSESMVRPYFAYELLFPGFSDKMDFDPIYASACLHTIGRPQEHSLFTVLSKSHLQRYYSNFFKRSNQWNLFDASAQLLLALPLLRGNHLLRMMSINVFWGFLSCDVEASWTMNTKPQLMVHGGHFPFPRSTHNFQELGDFRKETAFQPMNPYVYTPAVDVVGCCMLLILIEAKVREALFASGSEQQYLIESCIRSIDDWKVYFSHLEPHTSSFLDFVAIGIVEIKSWGLVLKLLSDALPRYLLDPDLRDHYRSKLCLEAAEAIAGILKFLVYKHGVVFANVEHSLPLHLALAAKTLACFVAFHPQKDLRWKQDLAFILALLRDFGLKVSYSDIFLRTVLSNMVKFGLVVSEYAMALDYTPKHTLSLF